MASAEPSNDLPIGRLAYNGQRILMLQSSLSGLSSDLGSVPSLIHAIAKGDCWRAFKLHDTGVIRWNPAEFRQFIESKRPEGCETPLHVLERALRGSDVWETYLDLVRGTPGNPTGANQHTEGNRDTITVSSDPSIIPFDPPTPKPRDYSREAPTGTSVSYANRRLKTHRPDLHEKVQVGELSHNAAMIEAGFKKPTITLPVDPEAATRLIVKHFKDEALADLIRRLVSWSGIDPQEGR